MTRRRAFPDEAATGTHSTPMGRLRKLVHEGATGELICVGAGFELHVYLQAGRVAWATDSVKPFAFSRRLCAEARISKEVLQEVLESCRREQTPLGETLIEWRLATPEQVTSALRDQIAGTLETLAGVGVAETVFLDRGRQYAAYDASLTFVLDELARHDRAEGEPTSAPAQQSDDPAEVVRRIRAEIPDASWIQVLEGERVLVSDPPANRPEVAAALLDPIETGSVDYLALRSERGALLGARLPHGRASLWCRLAAKAPYGVAATALTQLGAVDRPAPRTPDRPQASLGTWRLGDEHHPASLEVRGLLRDAPEVVAAVVFDGARSATQCGAGRGASDPAGIEALVKQRAKLLDVVVREDDAHPEVGPVRQNVGLTTLVTAQRDGWCFAALVAAPAEVSVWLIVRRDAGEGLGWTYLNSLRRRLSRLSER